MFNRTWTLCAIMAGAVIFQLGISVPAEAALVGSWDLDEGSGGTTFEAVGGTNDPLFNGPTWITSGLPPVPGGNAAALSFDGTDDYVESAFAGVGGTNPRSVAFWVRASSVTNHGIVAWGDSTSNGEKWHVRLNDSGANGRVVGAIRTEAQGGNLTGTTNIADGNWHHVASVFSGDDNANVIHYIDGVPEVTSFIQAQAVNTDITSGQAFPVRIGARDQTGTLRAFAGDVDAVRIYDHALLPSEVRALAGVTGVLANYEDEVLADSPFAYWRLNETQGNTAINLGSVGPALDATHNSPGGFTFAQPSLLPNNEDRSLRGDGSTSNGGTEIRIPDHPELNQSAHDNKSISLWFEAESVTGRQVLYEQGGNTRGINIYVEEINGVDTLFMGAWNLAESNWPVTFVSAPIEEGETYNAVFVLEGDPDGNNGTNDGFVRGYLNGLLFEELGGAGQLRAHGDNAGLFGIEQNARFADGSTMGNGLNFLGRIDEVALFNTALTADQIAAQFQAAQIPEPATAAMLALGTLSLLRRRRALRVH